MSRPTKGPHTNSTKAASVGKACHIHASAPGGPRYEPTQTEDDRRSIDNGIWLCSNCGTLIDTDEARFPESLLRRWKLEAELHALERIGKTQGAIEMTAGPAVEVFLDYEDDADGRGKFIATIRNVGTEVLSGVHFVRARTVPKPGRAELRRKVSVSCWKAERHPPGERLPNGHRNSAIGGDRVSVAHRRPGWPSTRPNRAAPNQADPDARLQTRLSG